MQKRLSERVIGCAQRVSKELGSGFLEAVYENALALELTAHGIGFDRQRQLAVYYKGENVGDYKVDMVVEDQLIIELKAVSVVNRQHKAQVINYLRATGFHVGLLLNFGQIPLSIQRIVWKYDDDKKI